MVSRLLLLYLILCPGIEWAWDSKWGMEMSDLALLDVEFKGLQQSFPQLTPMIQGIQRIMPELNRARTNFGKTQSQFMDNMLTVSHATPMRNLHQLLAEIEQVRMALRENYYKQKKLQIRLSRKQFEIDQIPPEAEDDRKFKRQLLEVDIEEKLASIKSFDIYIAGAIKRLANYSAQYEKLLEKLAKDQGVTNFDELDFEAAEEKHHIMKAFEQALCAARSHGGVIDEGNQIYFYQIGINGGVAQIEVHSYLITEAQAIQSGLEVSHNVVLEFLEAMAEKFKGCSKTFAEWKGMSTSTREALFLKE